MRLLTERRHASVAAAAVLFASIFVARAMVGTLGDATSFLYVIPVVLVAISAGTRAGLLAGAVAFALSSLGTLMLDQPATAVGYVNRAVVFLFIGALVGRFATTLRELEAESARHFDLSLDMISIVGFDGRFKSVNPAFERSLGYRPEELVGRPFMDFVHPDDRGKTEREAVSLSSGAKTVQFQNRYFAKDGGVRWMEWTAIPLQEEEMIYGVARDITDRKALELELERLSQRDPLTGLFNRRRFEEELSHQLAYTRRYGSGGALLMIDLDRFKRINDELGHEAGDEALRAVARVLDENLRAGDTLARDVDGGEGAVVARLGGDEFVALLPEADRVGAEAAAGRLVEAVRTASVTVYGRPLELRISVGVATFDEHGRPAEKELLAAADRAMYVAKAGGGSGARLAASSG
ncbi:MAG TPA: diguanylate cyclase [Solirubrobacterales bacterium]|nr:diguanylate cyclase [Solirubrobacterales bacterium]